MIRNKTQLAEKMKLVREIDKLVKSGYSDSYATKLACGYKSNNGTAHNRISVCARILRSNGMKRNEAVRLARKLVGKGE